MNKPTKAPRVNPSDMTAYAALCDAKRNAEREFHRIGGKYNTSDFDAVRAAERAIILFSRQCPAPARHHVWTQNQMSAAEHEAQLRAELAFMNA